MRGDELRGVVVVAEVARKLGAAPNDLQGLPTLQKTKRTVETVRRAHGRDLLAARDRLAAPNRHAVKMSIESVDIFEVAVLAIGVPHDDHVPPPHVTIARENNNPVADAVNRISQIGVATTNPVPVFAQMSLCAESARLVINLRIRFADE